MPHMPKMDLHMHMPHVNIHMLKLDMYMPDLGSVVTHLFAPNAYNASSPHSPDGQTHGYAYESMIEANKPEVEMGMKMERPHQRRGSKGTGKERVRNDSLDVHVEEHHEQQREEDMKKEPVQVKSNENDGSICDGGPLCREAEIERRKAKQDGKLERYPFQRSWVRIS